MAEREPTEVKNLDIYGSPPLDWKRVRDSLAVSSPVDRHFLGTVGADGRPNAAGIGALWNEGEFYIVSGPGTRKSRNLAANPACTISAAVKGFDVVLEGEAARVTDAATLERLAAALRAQGWPAEVDGEALTAPYSAASAGPPPWWLYRITHHTVFAVAGEEPGGATRWRFA